MLLSACNGMFSGIYDDVTESSESEYGFVTPATQNSAGTIYINASEYTEWTYINFDERTATTLSVDEQAPADWDIAIHRYDAKTNGGAVAESSAQDFSSVQSASTGAFSSDVWTTSKIVVDMSTMMDGYLGYVESYYNETLSGWLNVDTSSMPPTYTPSNKIYVVRMRDGSKAAVRLANFMDASGTKGYMTIEYLYPLN